MLGGPIQETVVLFKQLKQNPSYKFFALTNWSAETFPIALERFDFLQWFDARLVSGEEKTRKPFPEFYQKLIDKFSVDPAKAVFIDDNLRNIKAGESFGIRGLHFTDAADLKIKLTELELI
jgi:2-haloacid dehalogenase